MKHIAKEKDGRTVWESVCGVTGGKLVIAALESDCDECREKLMIASHRNKGCEVRETPTWTPQPWKKEET